MATSPTPPPTGEETEATFARHLGLFDASMIGIGAMIGAGIFVLTGMAAGEAGPGTLLAFALNGLGLSEIRRWLFFHRQGLPRPGKLFLGLDAVALLYHYLCPLCPGLRQLFLGIYP